MKILVAEDGIAEELVVLREVYDGQGRDGLIELTDRIASTQIAHKDRGAVRIGRDADRRRAR